MVQKKTLSKEDYIKGFQIVFSYVQKFAYDAKVLASLSFVQSVGDALIPLITGKFFDALLKNQIVFVGTTPLRSVFLILILWVVISIIGFLASAWRGKKTNELTDKLYASYSENAFHHALDLPLSFHKKEKMSVILNTFNRSANDISTVFARVVNSFSTDILTLLISLVIAFSLSPFLTFFLLIGVILYGFTIAQVIAPGAELQRQNRKAWQTAWRATYEGVDNIATVKSMVSDEYEKKKISSSMRKIMESQFRIYRLFFTSNVIQNIITFGTRAVIFFLSIFLVTKNTLTVGQLIAFNSYVGMFFSPFINFTNYWQSFQNAFISLNESDKVLNIPKENYRPNGVSKLKSLSGAVSFKNVEFYYEKKNPVLKSISVDIKAGEVVALVGKSGEGKSTFIDLISGHYFPQKGTVAIDGVDTRKIDLRFLRSNIAVVPQEIVLFDETIETNIKYGSFKAKREQVISAANDAHALEFIEKMPKKWNQLVGDRGYKLSVGQKQRVAIARAMLRNPKILILDEPTSALDAESESIIQTSLKSLMKDRTTFIIAHRLSTVRHADKILVFKDGQIVEMGNHDELMKKEGGVYRNLFELQVGLH